MTMNTVGRPTRPDEAPKNDYIHPTLTGGRGLLQDEALIFELGGWDKTGVDLPDAEPGVADDLGDLHGRPGDWGKRGEITKRPRGGPGPRPRCAGPGAPAPPSRR